MEGVIKNELSDEWLDMVCMCSSTCMFLFRKDPSDVSEFWRNPHQRGSYTSDERDVYIRSAGQEIPPDRGTTELDNEKF
jgi:hypothetical protein